MTALATDLRIEQTTGEIAALQAEIGEWVALRRKLDQLKQYHTQL